MVHDESKVRAARDDRCESRTDHLTKKKIVHPVECKPTEFKTRVGNQTVRSLVNWHGRVLKQEQTQTTTQRVFPVPEKTTQGCLHPLVHLLHRETNQSARTTSSHTRVSTPCVSTTTSRSLRISASRRLGPQIVVLTATSQATHMPNDVTSPALQTHWATESVLSLQPPCSSLPFHSFSSSVFWDVCKIVDHEVSWPSFNFHRCLNHVRGSTNKRLHTVLEQAARY